MNVSAELQLRNYTEWIDVLGVGLFYEEGGLMLCIARVRGRDCRMDAV